MTAERRRIAHVFEPASVRQCISPLRLLSCFRGSLQLIAVAALVIGAAQASPAQTDSRPAFEAASIKPNKSCAGGRGSGGITSPGRVTLVCAQLRDLILTAYGIYGGGPGNVRMQVLGGPSWIDSDAYDFTVKAEGNPPVGEMYGPMLQRLLEDRFKLKVHREVGERPVYLLTVAKGGPRMQAVKDGSCMVTDIDHPLPKPAPGQPATPACGGGKSSGGKVEMLGVTMADLARQLGLRLDRDVLDKTALKGRFDVHLDVAEADWQIRFVAGGEVRDADSPPADSGNELSIFGALQQQLGLKLESGRGPVEVLVVDSIERPSSN